VLHKRYLIQRTIGQGGMGAVYQAKDTKRQTICAIKEMSLSMVPPEERDLAIQNFKIEAKILWGLNHPNLPTFSGFFSENQRYFLVMEYIDGTTLEALLERNRGPFPERRVLGWARQLCDVLEYLHSQNPPIIFRDMKPGNIMLTRDGQIKLIDFGIARFFRPTGSQDTQLLGTPGFAPPEQYGKAQTDERSDIYSLAMTLFQLLTDTLSEQGFGLKDVRSINPHISPSVAKALEKAASMEPDDRYNSVAEFQRALLGEGTFFFENGDEATEPEELAELCARYPEEAYDYLAAGEVELWLDEIGEADLARVARQIRTTIDDPQEAVERFLQAVFGPGIRMRAKAQENQVGAGVTIGAPGLSGATWLPKRTASPLLISPRALNFGTLYPGVSAPMAFTISSPLGEHVSGIIHSNDPWIFLDRFEFDAVNTRVHVRINSTKLLPSRHYTGTIIIIPDLDEAKEMAVMVEADIAEQDAQNGRRRRGGKTIGADLDEDDDDDSLTMGNITSVGPLAQAQIALNQASTPSARDAQKVKGEEKYGSFTKTTGGWDPLPLTTRSGRLIQYSLAFSAALMIGSLVYTLVASMQPLLQSAPLPPHPSFIVILAGLIPATTLGAVLINKENPWTLRDMVTRSCSSMFATLLLLALVRPFWQLLVHTPITPLELIVMLLLASVAATAGTSTLISDYIIFGTSWLLSYMRRPVIILSVIIGGGLGFMLTTGSALGCFTPLAILVGVGVALALVLHVDHLMKISYP
jgi:tRNA A-37 threonylcarbamoyl transferase component Bud32